MRSCHSTNIQVMSIQMPTALCPKEFPAKMPGKQKKMTQIFGPLPPTPETRRELPASGFSLAEIWLVAVIRGVKQKAEGTFSYRFSLYHAATQVSLISYDLSSWKAGFPKREEDGETHIHLETLHPLFHYPNDVTAKTGLLQSQEPGISSRSLFLQGHRHPSAWIILFCFPRHIS